MSKLKLSPDEKYELHDVINRVHCVVEKLCLAGDRASGQLLLDRIASPIAELRAMVLSTGRTFKVQPDDRKSEKYSLDQRK